jgi:hypothetical protein
MDFCFLKLKRPSPAARGVTLFECLIFCGVVVVVLTMGLEAIRVCRTIAVRSEVVSALSLAANDELSRAAIAPFDTLTSGTTSRTVTLTEGDPRSPRPIHASIKCRTQPLSPYLKEITVTADWIGGKDPARVVLATRVARGPGGAP